MTLTEDRFAISGKEINPPQQREWQGLTPSDFSLIEQLFGHKVANDCVFADIVCIIDQILKDKNT